MRSRSKLMKGIEPPRDTSILHGFMWLIRMHIAFTCDVHWIQSKRVTAVQPINVSTSQWKLRIAVIGGVIQVRHEATEPPEVRSLKYLCVIPRKKYDWLIYTWKRGDWLRVFAGSICISLEMVQHSSASRVKPLDTSLGAQLATQCTFFIGRCRSFLILTGSITL